MLEQLERGWELRLFLGGGRRGVRNGIGLLVWHHWILVRYDRLFVWHYWVVFRHDWLVVRAGRCLFRVIVWELLRIVVRNRVVVLRLFVGRREGCVHLYLVVLLLKKKRTGKSPPWWQRAAPEARTLQEIVDPVIEATPVEDRAALAAIWQYRASLELRVASTFSSLSVELLEHGTTQTVYEIVSQAVRDEVHHAQISAELAAKYRGDALVWPDPEPNNYPTFRGSKGAWHATLYIIVECCINETSACSILEASIAQAESPLAKAALSRILSDEINHARAGWAHLASPWVTPEMKRELPSWLQWLHSANNHDLLGDDAPLPREKYPTHGMLSRRRAREITYATLVDVMFPGYRRAGIDPSATEEWARTAFKQDLAAAV